MNIFAQIAMNIIKEQELIVGPLAWGEASKVSGLKIDYKAGSVEVEGSDPKQVIDKLVNQYKRLFGLASVEVCKEAARNFLSNLSPNEIPVTLQ